MGLIGHSAGEDTIVKVAVTADGTPIRDDHFDTAAGDRMVEYVPASQLRGAVDLLRDAHDRDRLDGHMPSIDWYKRVDAYLNHGGQ
jgi:hypothetical protein